MTLAAPCRPIASLTVVAVTAATLAGCSTSYTPAQSPRVAAVLDGGNPAFVRDGVLIEGGAFGTGLVDAVAGVPEAREHAETFRDLTIAGFVVGLVGAGAAGGGIGWFAVEDQDLDARAAPLGLAIGGLAVAIVGASLQIAAQPHYFDAINLYNDRVAPPGPLPPPAWGAPAQPLVPTQPLVPAQPVQPPPPPPAQPAQPLVPAPPAPPPVPPAP